MEYLVYEDVKSRISNFLNDSDKSFCFITSGSGTGKTSILMRYCEENKEVLYFKLPLTVLLTPKSILLAVLLSLGVPVHQIVRSEGQLKDRLLTVLQIKPITQIVIDDIQLIDEIDFNSRRLVLFELLKYISIEAKVKIVFSGTSIPELPASIRRLSDIA